MRRTRPNMVRPEAPAARPVRRADAGFAANRRRAFSLLELVIVMAIVTAVAGIGLMRYSRSLSRYRVQAACARLSAELQRIQTEARTGSQARVVKFLVDKAEIEVLTRAEFDAGLKGPRISLAENPYRASMRLVGLATPEVWFDGRGEGNAGGIIVLGSGGIEGAVIIEPGLGRAYVAGARN